LKPIAFLDGRVNLFAGDCLDVLAGLPENSVDSVCTDPPYHLTSIVKRFGGENAVPAQVGKTGAYARATAGFMGKKWDGGDIAFRVETWAAVLRVMKPGAHLLAFSGTRTYHRMVCAIEDAGFEIRDQIAWLYGSGFPKSHDVSKGIDRMAGAEREVVGTNQNHRAISGVGYDGIYAGGNTGAPHITAPATDAARQWQGFGSALKPALEPIVLARKPLTGTIAANVLRWGTGALNIDGCRVEGTAGAFGNGTARHGGQMAGGGENSSFRGEWKPTSSGRWPANLLHDGSEEVLEAFPESGGGTFAKSGHRVGGKSENCVGLNGQKNAPDNYGDEGSAARFFYSSKADAEDRLGSKHPTVKPLDLMQYLVRLITPPGGTCLDCFAGTGTTGEAAWREGFNAILIEREEEYQADIARRMDLAVKPAKRSAVAKTKGKLMGAEGTPLFGDAA
jgi:DNA modification methylase